MQRLSSRSITTGNRVARMLCYSLGPITGVLFLRLSQHGSLWAVRFHAVHSILMSTVWALVWSALRLAEHVSPWFPGVLARQLRFASNVAFAFAWVLLLVTAYHGSRLVIFSPLHQLAVKLARRYERYASV